MEKGFTRMGKDFFPRTTAERKGEPYLSINNGKTGKVRISKKLHKMMGEPQYVELRKKDGEPVLLIGVSDEKHGLKVQKTNKDIANRSMVDYLRERYEKGAEEGFRIVVAEKQDTDCLGRFFELKETEELKPIGRRK